MNSSPEAPGTGELWDRRAHGAPAVAYAASLIGSDVAILTDALSISLAASPEAADLLDGMEFRIRTLPTTVATESERCIFSVRGPILWSETITARANALGNEDVFVCSTTRRSFDTVENRVLVRSLDALARAQRAVRGPTGARVPPAVAERVAKVAQEAQHWRRHPRLADIKGGRLSGRDMARLRGGHRMARMAPVLAVRNRLAEPFVADDLDGLSDPATRRYHQFVVRVLGDLAEHVRMPETLSLSDGGLWAGAASWRHPAAGGATPAGLCYRGIPLLPPTDLLADATWAEAIPSDGVRVRSAEDVERFLERISNRAKPVPRSRSRLPVRSGEDRSGDQRSTSSVASSE